jgi:hypothetical protein
VRASVIARVPAIDRVFSLKQASSQPREVTLTPKVVDWQDRALFDQVAVRHVVSRVRALSEMAELRSLVGGVKTHSFKWSSSVRSGVALSDTFRTLLHRNWSGGSESLIVSVG